MGLMDKLKALQHKAADFIIKKLLGLLGCKKLVRRLNFFKKIGKSFKKAAKGVSKAAKGVAKVAKKGAKAVAKEAKKGVKTVGKVAKKAAQGIKKAAETVKKATENAGKFVAKATKKAAKLTAKFVKKYGGIIGKIACIVIRKVCKPACMAVVVAFRSVGAMINSTFHIPIGCLADALGAGCNKLCEVVCKKRRLAIRRRMILPANEHENKKGQLEGWKAKLHDDEAHVYQKKK